MKDVIRLEYSNRRRRGWPRKKVMWLVVLAVVVAAAVIFAMPESHPNKADVNKWFSQLPPHASDNDVYVMFTSHGIAVDFDRTYDDGGRTICGTIRKGNDILLIYVFINKNQQMTGYELGRGRIGF